MAPISSVAGVAAVLDAWLSENAAGGAFAGDLRRRRELAAAELEKTDRPEY
jgi:hypothetical protein